MRLFFLKEALTVGSLQLFTVKAFFHGDHMEGWIKIHRKILDGKEWFSEPFSRSQAWIDILLVANHTEKMIYVRGNKVVVSRGQFAFSEQTLSKRWTWSRGKVRRFINDLEMRQQIVQQKNNVITIYTVIKYEDYQSNDTTHGTADGPQTDRRRTADSTTEYIKNDKKGKNDKNTSTTVEVRELFPDVGKKVSVTKKTLEDIDDEVIDQIVADYQVPKAFVMSKLDDLKNYCQSTGKRYKNYGAALRNWVKRDAMKLTKEAHAGSRIVKV